MAPVLGPRDALLVGCGSLGARIGLRLADRGWSVTALRRDASAVLPPIVGLGVDLTRERPALPPLDLGALVVALTARPRTEEAYRATYVDGMLRALDAVAETGSAPARAVLVSSTGVFGDAGSPDTLLDESVAAQPSDGPAQVLLDAERAFLERLPHGTVLRLSGLYGPDSTFLQDQVRAGRITDPHRWTNRIHRDDAAAAVEHVITMSAEPGQLYLGTDDEPAQLGDVAAHLADLLGAPTPPAADRQQAHGKRLSNARLRATGWEPRYPSFRHGYH